MKKAVLSILLIMLGVSLGALLIGLFIALWAVAFDVFVGDWILRVAALATLTAIPSAVGYAILSQTD